MSSITDLTIYDGEDVPVDHTMKAIDSLRENGVSKAQWREENSSLSLNALTTVEVTKTRLRSGVHKVTLSVAIPVMELVSGTNAAGYTAAPAVAHTVTGNVTFFFSERSTQQERRNIRMYLSNFLRGTFGSVARVDTGNIPELIDDLIHPA